MLFRKRRKPGNPAHAQNAVNGQALPQYFPLEFDQMAKGAIVKRRGRRVRQYAVMVGGNVRVVTSGDMVDLETYLALAAAGVVPPPAVSSDDAGAAPPSIPAADTLPPEMPPAMDGDAGLPGPGED